MKRGRFALRFAGCDTFYLRLALAAGFLTSITDRFGLWGPPGSSNVAWGDLGHFFDYTAKLNPHLPAAAIPALAWFVTFTEATLAVMLLTGVRTRYAALASGWLLLAFALGMSVGTGVKSALNASVFAASGGAFVLARAGSYRWSVDALLAEKREE
jgi:thiosulfate dehydrogenase (quinone) large subunit